MILVAGSSSVTKTVIYIDKNKNGMVDEGTDTIWAPTGKDTTTAGNSLSLYSIFGGEPRSDLSGDTNITMLGGKVQSIYGGGHSGGVTGETHVTVSGGTVDADVYGGGYTGKITGNTNVSMTGGSARILYGGGSTPEALVSGDTNVTVSGGTAAYIYGCGAYGGVGENVTISVSDGTISDSVYGGTLDGRNPIECNVAISMTGGTVANNVYTSGHMSSNTIVGEKNVTVGGNAKIGSVSNKSGIVINGDSNQQGVDSFIIAPDLGTEAAININLLNQSSVLVGNPIVATSAVAGDLAKITLVGTNAIGLKAYFDGDDHTIKLGYKTAISSVKVIPNQTVVPVDGQIQFAASVTGTGNPAQTVTWNVSGGVFGTNIDANGLLTVAANETATTLTVKATSTVDAGKFGTATVKVRKLTHIAIKTAPSKTAYIAGESFDKKDMVVVAYYDEGSTSLERTIENYTISPDGALAVSNMYVTVSFTDCGVTKTTTQAITVSDGTPPNSAITPTSATFDKYVSAIGYVDIAITQTLNSNTLTAIRNGSTTLQSDRDYTVSGNTITIKKEYLAQQPIGITTLTFDYSAGTDPVLAITVSDGTPSAIHKPVTGITGVPTTATTSVDLTLIGTVAPADATNKTIVWSVKSAGTTGATIIGNTLKTTTAGTVVVTAMITNGLTASDNYIQDFTIMVNASEPTYAVTVNEDGGTGASGSSSYAAGATVTLTAGTKIGSYSFSSWSLKGAAVISTSGNCVTFIMPANAVTAKINWTYTGGGGSTGSSGSSTTTTAGHVNVKPFVDANGNATITVSSKYVEDAIKKAQDEAKKNGTEQDGIGVTITLDTKKELNSFTITLPKSVQEKLIDANVTSLTINGGVTITFDLEALNHIYTTANADVMVTATKIASSTLSAEAQTAIGHRPVYDFKVTGGGKNITTFGTGKISISIPYELQRVDANGKMSETGSFENPGNLVGVYVDAKGKLTYLAGSGYNATSKTMRLGTDHLSLYGVAYQTNAPTFTDTASHWAKDDIQFVVARGLLTGTGGNQFGPDGEMTRGMFVTALGRLANADVSGYKTGSFSDVATESYYLGYVEWAVKNKIATGTSATTFAPDRSISREEMAVMLQSYTRAMGYRLPNVHVAMVFTDNATIAPWAQTAVKEMQMAGILYGRDGGKFAPNGTATRAEASAMLRRFVELVINGATV